MKRNNSVTVDLEALKEKHEKLAALSEEIIRCITALEQKREQLAAYHDNDEARQMVAVIAKDLQSAGAFESSVKMVFDGLTEAIRIYAEADSRAFGIVKSMD